MPTYDYFCKNCNETKEIVHSIKEDPEILCEKCHEHMRRLVSGGSGHIIKSGGTRNQTWKQRHGHKLNSSRTTPSESAQIKAQEKVQELHNADAKAADPYFESR
jgi:putative FmdB family regulatory protein